RSELRFRRAGGGRGGRQRHSRSAFDLGRQGRIRRHCAEAGPALRRQFRAVRGARRRGCEEGGTGGGLIWRRRRAKSYAKVRPRTTGELTLSRRMRALTAAIFAKIVQRDHGLGVEESTT